jgi:DNA-binding NarL/FixJ family response regulator
MKRARLLLGDDHALVAEGFRRILQPAFDVVGIAETGSRLVESALELRPDVIVIDVALPDLDGFEASRRIIDRWPDARICFLTMYADLTYLQQAILAGASGYVLKNAAGDELVKAIADILAGRTYVSPEVARNIHDPRVSAAFEDGHPPVLTDRQRQVINLVARGRSDKEIARELNISVRTVRFHRTAVAHKLGISGAAALTRYAIVHGLGGHSASAAS